jgi:hypothetical protein
MTTAGIKAELETGVVREDVPTTAQLTVTDDCFMVWGSAEDAIQALCYVKEWDNITYTTVSDLAGTDIRPTGNDNPNLYTSPVPMISGETYVKNIDPAAKWICIGWWRIA